MEAGMSLTKAAVARRQLGTALALYLADQDPVSVLVLACGGGEISEHLARTSGKRPFSDYAMSSMPELTRRDLRQVRNQFWNAFKHASGRREEERQDAELLARFDDVQNDHHLWVGWYDYGLGAGCLPVEAQVFQVWYFALYPEKLDPSSPRAPIPQQTFPALRDASRTDQKRALREYIASVRLEPAIIADPRTDTEPLIMS